MVREITPNDIWILLEGLKWTILLSAIAFAGGGVVGLIVALLRTSPSKVLRTISYLYIELFQGTPLLMQLFVIYYGVALVGLDVNAWVAAAIGLTAHASAFLGEIWRGGIEAVPRGQTEAARALGLSYRHRMLDIVLPQAFRISLPATVGFLVGLIKGTSLVAIVGFTELTRAGQIISNNTFQPLIVFGLVGAMYFALCWPLSVLSDRLEKRMSMGA
ncbi:MULTISPECIES: amino acid ABC transporter permease [unclassified Mesorhizobium]|uniref:amino acid ABC transporter permease n=1 Tax=unclassified Mesorhizobium TaxID=325217 RepID=UPI002414DCEF|nr:MULTISPECIES: amino acid ABC transporter permease [unclassified Mesorhizobium]MDG4889940.1 amino acid ABC transporter permease [Mesorhizobium sp. WSM4887]MDG4904083.1 amino acid ABC transporter permease [Mesorhizobium sp. WSM4962]MDG4909110.1 amino acid ABC transporter permease [Mesorhizobium sp. WSM4898]MDG4921734.1 amino acid ABC transporter permease [Mesorhizobium sp. WSM4989]